MSDAMRRGWVGLAGLVAMWLALSACPDDAADAREQTDAGDTSSSGGGDRHVGGAGDGGSAEGRGPRDGGAAIDGGSRDDGGGATDGGAPDGRAGNGGGPEAGVDAAVVERCVAQEHRPTLWPDHGFVRCGQHLIGTTTRFDANVFAIDVATLPTADVTTAKLAIGLKYMDVRGGLIFATRTVGGYLTDEVAALRFENGAFQEVSSLPLRGSRHGIVVNGDVAYVMTSQAVDHEPERNLPGGIAVVDIGNPEAMVARGAVDLAANLREGFIAGGRLFAIGQNGTYVYDLSDPIAPVEVAYLDEWIGELAVDGNLVYAVRQGDLKVFDITQIEEPTEERTLSRFRTPIWDVVVANDKAYALESNALQVFDITDVEAPRRERVYLWDGGAPYGKLAIVGAHAVIGSDGLRFIDLARCEQGPSGGS